MLHHLMLNINLSLKDEEGSTNTGLLLLYISFSLRQNARPPPDLYWCNWGDESCSLCMSLTHIKAHWSFIINVILRMDQCVYVSTFKCAKLV